MAPGASHVVMAPGEGHLSEAIVGTPPLGFGVAPPPLDGVDPRVGRGEGVPGVVGCRPGPHPGQIGWENSQQGQFDCGPSPQPDKFDHFGDLEGQNPRTGVTENCVWGQVVATVLRTGLKLTPEVLRGKTRKLCVGTTRGLLHEMRGLDV